MKQVAYAGLKKALTTVSVVTAFAAGLLADGGAVYAQERKEAQSSKIEAEALAAMQLPGIFKVTPEAALEIPTRPSTPRPTT